MSSLKKNIAFSAAENYLASLRHFRLTSSPAIVRYTFAVTVPALALGLQILLRPWVGPITHFMLFPAVYIVLSVVGFRPGCLAILVAAFGADYFFIPPLHQIKVASDQSSFLRFILFSGTSLITAWLIRRTHRAEQILADRLTIKHEGEEKFQVMADSAPVMVWIANTEKQFTWVNKGWLDFTGRSLEQEIGDGWREGVHPEDAERCLSLYDESFDARQEFFMEYRLKHRSGFYRWNSNKGVPRFDENGTFEGYTGACMDIHDQKQAQESLSDSQEDFAALANNIPQLAWMADNKGWLFWYNQRWYEYTGTTFEDMQGWGWQKVHDPVELARMLKTWNRSLETGEPWEDVFPLRSKSGELRWFLSRAFPIRDKRGRIVRWFGTNTDIEEQRRSQEEMQRTAEKLEKAVRSRDEFLSIASHELKTPLTTLKLQAQSMNRSIAKGDATVFAPERVKALSEQSERQIARLGRLIDDMLDVSRISTGQLGIEKEDFNIGELIKDVVERMRPQFLMDVGSFPELKLDDQATGHWDKFRIEQVLTNLLTNSIRYGNQKPIEVKVTSDQNSVTVAVRDQGIGIADDNLERIFNRFERAVNASDISGLGLGLFISSKIVNAHGGKMRVESKLGEGSVFYVWLPRKFRQGTPPVATDIL